MACPSEILLFYRQLIRSMMDYACRIWIFTCKPIKEKYIRINNTDVEKINQAKYLGTITTNNSKIMAEISHKIDMEINVTTD
jgi:hypothetical protein